jgi:hypothetical protein
MIKVSQPVNSRYFSHFHGRSHRLCRERSEGVAHLRIIIQALQLWAKRDDEFVFASLPEIEICFP